MQDTQNVMGPQLAATPLLPQEVIMLWQKSLKNRLENFWFDAEEPLMLYQKSGIDIQVVISRLEALAEEAAFLSNELKMNTLLVPDQL